MANYELKLGLDLATFQAKLAQAVPGVKDLAQNMEAAFNKALGAGTEGLDQWKTKLKSLGDDVAAFSARFKTMLSSLSQAGAQDEAVDRRFTNIFGAADESASKFAETIGSKYSRAVADVKQGMLDLKFTADQFGFTADETAKLSQELTELGVRFAQFRGIGDSEAFGAIQQALLGNTRGLKQFGIAIDEAAIKEKAFAMGLGTDKLSEQATVLVILALLKERMAVAANAAAGAEQSFGAASRDLHNQLGELAGELGRIVNDAIQPFVKYAAAVVKSVRDWIREFPILSRVVIDVGVAVGGLATGITMAAGAINIGVQAVKFYTTAVAAWGPIQATLNAAMPTFAAALGQVTARLSLSAGAASALGTGLGYLSAAFAGFAIGIAIDKLVGFSDAAVKCAKGTSTWSDEIKAGFINILVPATLFSRAMDAAKVAAAKLEEQKLGEKLRDTFSTDQLKVYNTYLAAGLDKYKATMLATNEINELEYLRAKGVKATANEIQRMIVLEARNQDYVKALAAAQAEATAGQKSAIAVRGLQGEEEKKFQEAVKKSEIELIRARQGETAASIEEARREAEQRLKILVDGAKAQAAKISELAEARNRLQAAPPTSANREALKKVQADLDAELSKYKMTRDGILGVEEEFNSKLKTKTEERVSELRQKGDQQIADARRAADETAKAYHATLDAVEKDLDELRARRAKGDADVEGLLKELQTNALRRQSPILADIKVLEERTAAVLRNGGAEKSRNALVEEALATMKAEANLQPKITEATARANEERQRAAELQGRGDTAGALRATEEALKSETEATKLRQQQSDAQTAIARAQADLNAAAVAGGEEKKNVEFMIGEAQQHQAYLLQVIDDLHAATVKKTETLLTNTEGLVTNAKRFGDEMQHASDATATAAKLLTGFKGLGAAEKKLNYKEILDVAIGQSQGAAGAASDAKVSATEAAKAAATTATAATAANQASQNLGQGLATALQTTTGAVNNLTAQSAQIGTVTQLVPRMAEQLTAMVTETQSYGEKMNNFAGIVLDKAGQTAATLRKHGAALVHYGVRLGKIEMGGTEDASLAAAGLGG